MNPWCPVAGLGPEIGDNEMQLRAFLTTLMSLLTCLSSLFPGLRGSCVSSSRFSPSPRSRDFAGTLHHNVRPRPGLCLSPQLFFFLLLTASSGPCTTTSSSHLCQLGYPSSQTSDTCEPSTCSLTPSGQPHMLDTPGMHLNPKPQTRNLKP